MDESTPLKRRSFLKASAATAASLFLRNAVAADSRAQSNNRTIDSTVDMDLLSDKIEILTNYIRLDPSEEPVSTTWKVKDGTYTGSDYRRHFEIDKRRYFVNYSQTPHGPVLTISGWDDRLNTECTFVNMGCKGYLPKEELNPETRDFVLEKQIAEHHRVKKDSLFYSNWDSEQRNKINVEYGKVIMDILRAIVLEDLCNKDNEEVVMGHQNSRSTEYKKSYKVDRGEWFVSSGMDGGALYLRISDAKGITFIDTYVNGFEDPRTINVESYPGLWNSQKVFHKDIATPFYYAGWKPHHCNAVTKEYDKAVMELAKAVTNTKAVQKLSKQS